MAKAIADRLSTKLANTVVEDEGGGGGTTPPGTEPVGPSTDGVGGLVPGVLVLSSETEISNFCPPWQCVPKVQMK